ncbi:MAG: TonB-dependent receptor [Bacteroidales bacterium]|nr:TonB-dependent receptor [Bacteroidales bacterium]
MIKFLHFKMFVFLALILFGVSALGQNGKIVGTVSDKDSGETLPGANIMIKGTNIGMSTDINGVYSINNAPLDKITLVCSYVGYLNLSKDVTIVSGQTLTVDFALQEDNMMLDEIVVIGFGTKRKRDITTSISKVKAEEIEGIPVANFAKSLQGRAPGVQVTSDNGIAGGAITMRIRGTSSLKASSEPLYVVDGVPVITGSFTTSDGFPDKSNALSQINPSDIASYEILKDASAAAVYGSRGTNGVVLITTKSGSLQKGKGLEKTNFSFNYSAGILDVTNRMKILDGPQYLALSQEAYWNSVHTEETSPLYKPELSYDEAMANYYNQLPYGITEEIAKKTNTNWVDEALRQGFVQEANLSASGGNTKSTYYLGGGYFEEKGILIDNKFKRINGRINFTHNATEKLSFGANTSISYTIDNRVPTGWQGGLGTAQSRSIPIMPIYDSTGGYYAAKTSGHSNIRAEINNLDYEARILGLISNVFGQYRITPFLSFKTEFGLNNLALRESKYEGLITQEDQVAQDRRVLVNNWIATQSLNYFKTFNGVHNVTGLLSYVVQESKQNDVWFTGKDFPSPSLTNPNSGAIRTAGDFATAFGYASYVGRFTYNYSGKYYATFSLRADGSSRFGKDNKWGYFPAGSIGWSISEEKFMQNVDFLSFLKLRISYGITGNSEIDNFGYYGSYNTNEQYYGSAGITPNNVGNKELGWEKTSQIDIGIDFGFFDGRIHGGMDYYNKLTSDLLIEVNVPQTSGFSKAITNIGKLENKGFEFFITSYNLTQGKIKWNTDFNISYNKNEITELPNNQKISGISLGGNYGNNYAVVGYPAGVWELVDFAGVDPETGKPLFINQETGEATTEYNYDRDAILTGNPYPEWIGGLNNTITYDNFDLGILFTWSLGHNVYRDDGKFLEGGKIGENWNQMQIIEDRWQKPGDITDIPKLIYDGTYSTYNTTQYLDDASYVRLKTFQLGYTLPNKITQKIHMTNVRFYFNANNLLTFTKYKGWDPEVNRDYGSNNNVTQGVTYLSPPQVKSFTFGVNMNF